MTETVSRFVNDEERREFYEQQALHYTDGKMPPAEILYRISTDLYRFKGIGGSLYWYQDGIYDRCDDGRFQNFLRSEAELIKIRARSFTISTHGVKEIINRIRDLNFIDDEELEKERSKMIAFSDGLLSMEDLMKNHFWLKPSSPDYVVLSKIPHEFSKIPFDLDMNAPILELGEKFCPKITKFFKETVDNFAQFQFEKFGYSMIPGYPLPAIFIEMDATDGQGRNGKTTTLNLISQVLGQRNIKHFSMQALCEPKSFYVFHLFDKYANVGDEIPYSMVEFPEALKMLSGGSWTTGILKLSNTVIDFINSAS